MPKVMILDFFIKLGDHKVMVQVDELANGNFNVIVRELGFDNSAIVDIDATFVSLYSAKEFGKYYVQYYMNEV